MERQGRAGPNLNREGISDPFLRTNHRLHLCAAHVPGLLRIRVIREIRGFVPLHRRPRRDRSPARNSLIGLVLRAAGLASG